MNLGGFEPPTTPV